MAEYGALFPPEFHQFNDKYAQHVHDARHTVSATVAASTPTITTLSGSDFLHKLSATILGSLQFQASRHAAELTNTFSTVATGLGQPTTTTTPIPRSISANNMDYEMTPNRVLVDSSSFSSMDEMQKQLEYDKFMNEIWIGIVLTLIVISLVFCICSCFLYHQFRTWKRNYNATVAEAQTIDVEAVKLNPDREDPVPEYTLVSGLPSYEAALELLHKTPSTCVIVYPSVFSVFNRHEEKLSNSTNNNNNNNVDTIDIQQQQQQQQQQQLQQQQQQLQQHQQQLQQFTITNESSSTPLMAETMSVKSSHDVPSYAEATTTTTTTVAPLPATTTTTRMISLTCVNEKSSGKKSSNDSTTTTTTRIYEKVPSYEEALMVKSFDTKTSS